MHDWLSLNNCFVVCYKFQVLLIVVEGVQCLLWLDSMLDITFQWLRENQLVEVCCSNRWEQPQVCGISM